MGLRGDMSIAGYAIPSPCVITWLGQDDGFAADLALMAVQENKKGCILSDPLNAVVMPLGSIVIIPCLTEETVREWNTYQWKRLQVTGNKDSVTFAVASCYTGTELTQYACKYIEGPLFKVHCEWMARN